MTVYDCTACGCSHDSAAQAESIHLATASIHAWLREKMRLVMLPVVAPVTRKRVEVAL